jgi:hypothetical protein
MPAPPPFALNRPHLASLQLRSHVVAFSLDVWPLPLDSPVHYLVPCSVVEPLLLLVGLRALVGKPPPSVPQDQAKVDRVQPLTGYPGHHFSPDECLEHSEIWERLFVPSSFPDWRLFADHTT